ncbi:MAG TPA: tRNA (adenosine(37)-N6)-dimethylallyltransferase MiaA [candidate division Zixibacteria bacterium]|nr:tRNA (adenosine(37)-N6)-dimethylallyltransferase MiaA [candidate division Zixibacteria bacterium]HEQ99718.1 tRNA (adenosine(37)-N6)-dimethylallyltransferase MiaA [candidate division Zixibacteria bacterium]
MEGRDKKKVLGLLGPTGVGKTGLAIELCQRLNGEVVSCDSRQIYKELDIGTAKPDEEEQRQVRHHLINIAEIGEVFSAYRYRQMALNAIEDIFERGKQPLVVGGTGLYYRALTEGFFEVPENDQEFRQKLEEEAEEYGNERLWNRLNTVDPESAEKISVSDRFRIIRALEIYELSGIKKSELSEKGEYPESCYKFITFGLNVPRRELYERINSRVDKMLEEGWIEETERLISASKLNSRNFQKFMGYNYLYKYVKGQIDRKEGIAKIKQAHRNYAKRQLTWFKRVSGITWISAKDQEKAEKIVELFTKQ